MAEYKFELVSTGARFIHVKGVAPYLIPTSDVTRIYADENKTVIYLGGDDGRHSLVEIETDSAQFIKKYLEFLNGE